MTATGYTGTNPLDKVSRSGDTMTGDLVLNDSSPDTALSATPRGYVDNATQAITAAAETRYVNAAGDSMTGRLQLTAGNVDIDVQQAMSTDLTTGVIYGGELNATPGVTGSVRIGATVGYVVDFLNTPSDPLVTLVTIPQQDVLLDGTALTRAVTWFLADTSGNILQQATRPTNAQRRTHLQLGVVAQAGGTIFIDQSLPVILNQPINQLYDLMYALGSFNIEGNNLAPATSGATLQLLKTVGHVFVPASNYLDGPTLTNDPHVSLIPAQNPVSIRYVTSIPSAPTPLVTSVNPANYDLNGVVTAIGGTGTRSTIQRVFLVPANATQDQIVIQYGSNIYNTHSEAVASLGTDAFTQNPNLTDAILIGYLVMTRTATDLNNVNHVKIFGSSKFGGQPAGGSALGVLAAYAPLSGATFTGPVILAADPTSALQAATKQYVDNLPAAGSIRSAEMRATNDNLAGLASAPSWTIITTSGGTQLKCSIAAAVGDRIKILGNFMRSGSRFLDWAVQNNSGGVSRYITTRTSTPPAEGNPTMYPSLSFPQYTTPPVFTVTSDMITAGQVTVGLYNQGTSAAVVYAHATYPFDLRLENYGPEPS